MTNIETQRELRWILIGGAASGAELPIDKEPFPPRDPGDVTDLISSVRLQGVLSPILVRVVGGRYQIICGFRRYLAARKAGIAEIPALIVDMEDAAAVRCYLASKAFRREQVPSEQEKILRFLKEIREARPRPRAAEAAAAPGEPSEAGAGGADDLAGAEAACGVDAADGAVGVEATDGDDGGEGREPVSSGEVSRRRIAGIAVGARPAVSAMVRRRGARPAAPPPDVETRRLSRLIFSPQTEGDRLSGELLLRTEALFSEVRLTRQIGVRTVDALADDFLAVLDGPVPVDLRKLQDGGPDDFHAAHSLLVAALCAHVGRSLDWDAETLRSFVLGGLLHDIGMAFVRSPSIRLPRALTQAERAEIHSHTRIGCALIAGTQAWMTDVAVCARDHHERWDGSGYPSGAPGSDIGFPARLLGLLDTYGALLTPRPHRDALEPSFALERLAKALELGLFDPTFHFLLKTVLAKTTIPGLDPAAGARATATSRGGREAWTGRAALAPTPEADEGTLDLRETSASETSTP